MRFELILQEQSPQRELQLMMKLEFHHTWLTPKQHDSKRKYSTEIISNFKKSIIFENSNFLVVNKSSGISSHSGTKQNFGLIDIVRSCIKGEDIDLCHRLDKDTSGCIVISKNKLF